MLQGDLPWSRGLINSILRDFMTCDWPVVFSHLQTCSRGGRRNPCRCVVNYMYCTILFDINFGFFQSRHLAAAPVLHQASLGGLNLEGLKTSSIRRAADSLSLILRKNRGGGGLEPGIGIVKDCSVGQNACQGCCAVLMRSAWFTIDEHEGGFFFFCFFT